MKGTDGAGFQITRGRCMKRVIVLLTFLFAFLLSTQGVHAEYVCTDCHNGQHSPDCVPSCETCHGYPPVDNGGLVHQFAGMGAPTATGSASPGAHAIHATPSGSNYPCDECHYGGMKQGVGIVGNNKIQIGFSITNGSSPDPLTGGAYDGAALNPPYTYEATNGTTVTTGGAKTCSGMYCHSDGTSVATGVIRTYISPAWDSGGPLSCDTCHGFPPSYAQGQPKANSHMATSHNSQTCNVCHYTTTTDGATITDFTRHKNANGVYDVVPDPSAAFNGVPVAFTYNYDAAGGTCSAVSCHGGAGLTWGQPITGDCTACHPNVGQSGADQNHHAGSCTDCHMTDSWPLHQGVTKECTDCHDQMISKLIHPSVAGKTPETCVICHTPAGNYPGVKPANLDSACGQCHNMDNAVSHGAPYISANNIMQYASNIHGGGVVGGPVSPLPVKPPSPGCDSTLTADGILGNGTSPTNCTTTDGRTSCPGTLETTFTLTDNTIQGHTLFINWGDGSPLSSSQGGHNYDKFGIYNITQTVTNSCGYRSQKFYFATIPGGPTGKGTLVISAAGTGSFSLSYALKDGPTNITNNVISVGESKTIMLDPKDYTVDIRYQSVTPLTDPLTYHSCTTPAGGTLSADGSIVTGIPVSEQSGVSTTVSLTGCNN